MSADDLHPKGPFAVFDGEELVAFKPAGWSQYALGSARPRPGFEPDERGRLLRALGDDDDFECVKYEHRATYRAKIVAIEDSNAGRAAIHADTGHTTSEWSDREANEAGFDFREPGVWSKVVELEDPDLVVVTSRVRVDPPWLKKSEG